MTRPADTKGGRSLLAATTVRGLFFFGAKMGAGISGNRKHMTSVIKKGEHAKDSLPKEEQAAHQEVRNSRYQAARLEGKVQNRGIKNLGRNARKAKKGK